MNIGQFMDWNSGIKSCENKFHRLAVALTFH